MENVKIRDLPCLTRLNLEQFIAPFLILIFCMFSLQPALLHDAYHYFSYARSIAFDGDIDFRNEAKMLKPPVSIIIQYPNPSTDNSSKDSSESIHFSRNIFPPGVSIFWMPFYSVFPRFLIPVFSSPEPAGYQLNYRLAASLGAIFYLWTAIFLLFDFLKEKHPTASPAWSLTAMLFGSPLVAYFSREPLQSEALAFCLSTFFVVYSIRNIHSESINRFAILGLLIGLNALVRWQNALLIVIPILTWKIHEYRDRFDCIKKIFLRSLIVLSVAGIIFTPQLLVWHQQTCSLNDLTPHLVRISASGLINVLFSFNRGLFMWSPALIPGVIGLFFLLNKSGNGRAYLAALAVQLLVNAFRVDWWGGAGFGARRFVACLPIMVIGLQEIFNRLTKYKARYALVVYIILAMMLSILLLNSHYCLNDFPPSNASSDELSLQNLMKSLDNISLLFKYSVSNMDYLRTRHSAAGQFSMMRFLTLMGALIATLCISFPFAKLLNKKPGIVLLLLALLVLIFNMEVLF